MDMIFEKALKLGYTKQGEIFNVQFLADLAEHCGFTTQILTRGLHAHVDCIIHNLLQKNLVLVPYPFIGIYLEFCCSFEMNNRCVPFLRFLNDFFIFSRALYFQNHLLCIGY